MKVDKLLLYGFISMSLSCGKGTEDEQIKNTCQKVGAAIENNNESAFRKLIGVDLSQIGKNEERVSASFQQIQKYYEKYMNGKDLEFVITDSIVPVIGKRIVRFPIFNGIDSTEYIREVRLDVYVGPPQMVPLNKITDFELVVTYDPNKPLPPPPSFNF